LGALTLCLVHKVTIEATSTDFCLYAFVELTGNWVDLDDVLFRYFCSTWHRCSRCRLSRLCGWLYWSSWTSTCMPTEVICW